MSAYQTKSIFGDYTRIPILIISLICVTLLLSNSLALNFTIICMESNTGNASTVYDYSPAQKSWLFSAVAVGSLIGTVPITELFTLFGTRKVTTVYGLISSVATLFSPLAASRGFYWLVAMRAVQGFAVTVTFPATGAVTASWATLAESGTFLAILSVYLQIAPIFTMPVAGGFCVSRIGWRGVYYLQGGLTAIFFIVFFVFYRDTPRKHRTVSPSELMRIENGKTGCDSKPKRTPYLTICKDLTIIGIWVANVGASAAFQIFLQYGPTYLNKVLNYEISKTGFATALPFVLSLLMKVVAGPFSDRATCLGERTRLIVFTVASQGTMAICFVILAQISHHNGFIGWLAYAISIAFSGLNCVGLFKCAQMVSRQYFPFVMAVMSFFNSLSILYLPFFVNLMAPNNTAKEWALVFYVICGVVIATNAVFCFVCRGDPAPWTKVNPRTMNSRIFVVKSGTVEDGPTVCKC